MKKELPSQIKGIDKTVLIRDIVTQNSAENYAISRFKTYRDIMMEDKGAAVDPNDFAKFFDIEVKEGNLDKCDKALGILTIKEDGKASILIEKSLPEQKKKYIIAYESIRYLIEDKLDLTNSPGLLHDYNENSNNDNNEKDVIGNICQRTARKMLMREYLFKQEYKKSNNIQNLANTFDIEAIHVGQRIKDLNLI